MSYLLCPITVHAILQIYPGLFLAVTKPKEPFYLLPSQILFRAQPKCILKEGALSIPERNVNGLFSVLKAYLGDYTGICFINYLQNSMYITCTFSGYVLYLIRST